MSGEIISRPLDDPVAEAVALALVDQVNWTDCSCQDPDSFCWYHMDDIEKARVVALRIMETIRHALQPLDVANSGPKRGGKDQS